MAGIEVQTGELVDNKSIRLRKTYKGPDIIGMIKYFLSNCWCLDKATCSDIVVRPVIGKFEVVICPMKKIRR